MEEVANTSIARPDICLLTHTQQYQAVRRLHLYADYLCHLMGGQLRHIEVVDPKEADVHFFKHSSQEFDLIIFGEPNQTFVNRLLRGPLSPKIADRVTTSLLVARTPRSPLRKLLLIVRIEETDDTAVDWVIRLARTGEVAVKVLPVVPGMLQLYDHGLARGHSKQALLADDSHAGAQLLRLTRRLAYHSIDCEVRSKQGEAHEPIRQEVEGEDYDLVVIGAESHERLRRWLLGELVRTMLHWIDTPLLIARPRQRA